MKETDLLLGQFAQLYLPYLSDAGLDEFQALLDAGDPNIFAWVRGDAQPPANLDGLVLAQIKKFQSEL
jgi:succinate dehydrogenase flavin-adding protein (antitoxin of CptAB toxin-antitoxin module)